MFDTKSDFALNKMDKEAIVCKSVTGIHIRLTCEDFDSKEEFDNWKKWSDGDYKDTESKGRDFYDNCVSLIEAANSTGASAEDVIIAPLQFAEQQSEQVFLLHKVRNVLTKKQYRRLWMLCVEGKNVAQIAVKEAVTPRAIYLSLAKAKEAITGKM